MTKQEAAVMTAFTGIYIGYFSDFHAYAEGVMGTPILSHQFGDPVFMYRLKEAARKDFIDINENITD